MRQELAVFLGYREAVVTTIQTEAADVAAQNQIAELPTSAPLDEAGPHGVAKDTLVVEDPTLHQTATGLTVNYDFPVDVYWPQGSTERSPVVIIPHGFGDVKDTFVFMAEHLASHGFVVMVPDHIGSDLNYRQQYLQGRLNTLLSPMEFLNRPQEISFLIDELERQVENDVTWANRLDLNNIGVMGDSLRGATALALAGAEINYARLATTCDDDRLIIDPALYLQCRARFLPSENYELRDDRIQAVSVTHPIGGFMYVPEGMSQIDIPLMMISGSNDIISPVVTEQIHPFIWVSSSDKILALLDVGTHFSSKPGREGATADSDPSGALVRVLLGDHRDVGTRYSKALNLAFWRVNLQGRSEYASYMTAAYGETLSVDQPMQVAIVRSLTPAQLETAYERTPPVAIIPPAIESTSASRDESVLAEIERTGVLKVALPKNMAPFGFINESDEWDGDCGAAAIALGQYLSTELDVARPIQVVELASTLQNRFDLVRDGTVHLDCGPNTIREDIPGIEFSESIYATGANFLVLNELAKTIRPSLPLAGLKLGVLQDSTTESFIRETYPRADIVTFFGDQNQAQAVQALATGGIDAFVGDRILSLAEVDRQNLPAENFTLVPETPLTCEYYGFILPNDDSAWKTLVDRFIRESAAVQTTFQQDIREWEACLDQ